MTNENILNTQIQYKLIEELRDVHQYLKEEISQKTKLAEKLRESQDGMKEEMQSKAFELQLKNEDLKREILERKQIEANIISLNNCFIGFGSSAKENICRIVSAAGIILKGATALYSKIVDNKLVIISDWKAPVDIKKSDDPTGHVCYDVIMKSRGATVILNDLQNSEYYESDPNIKKYGIKTYIGLGVKDGDKIVAALCIVYTDDKDFLAYDEKLISLLVKFIEIEESRAKSEERTFHSYRYLSQINRKITILSNFKGSKNNNFSEICDYITSSAINLSDINKCLLYGYKNNQFTLHSKQGVTDLEADILEKDIFKRLDIIDRVQKTKIKFQVDFSNEDQKNKAIKSNSLSSILCMPLMTKRNFLGVLVLLFQNGYTPNNQELEFYDILTHQGASSME